MGDSHNDAVVESEIDSLWLKPPVNHCILKGSKNNKFSGLDDIPNIVIKNLSSVACLLLAKLSHAKHGILPFTIKCSACYSNS